MVSKITFPDSLLDALNYHEQKVQKGKAELLLAENFLPEKDQLNFYDKLNRFKDQMELNTRAKTKLLHVSLNFDPSENLSKNELVQIATAYMDKIGFGDQPYLVYKHEDAGHPHIHLLTTTIQADGRRINTHKIGENQSEKARKEIEEQYGLIKAAGRNSRGSSRGIEPVTPEKVVYGKSETKRAITNVLDAVIKQYKYTSLAELNAILKQYNVMADRGHEEGRIYRTGGLVYRALDDQGNKVGVPIKASSVYSKPTLVELEKKFLENEMRRKPDRLPVRDRINIALDKAASLQEFIRELRKIGVDTVLRQNDTGLIYGITFVDNNSKSVFNGSDLGKEYSAAAIQRQIVSGNHRAETTVASAEQINIPAQSKEIKIQKEEKLETETMKSVPENKTHSIPDLIEDLMQAEKGGGNIPFELRKRKRKKRKRKPRL